MGHIQKGRYNIIWFHVTLEKHIEYTAQDLRKRLSWHNLLLHLTANNYKRRIDGEKTKKGLESWK